MGSQAFTLAHDLAPFGVWVTLLAIWLRHEMGLRKLKSTEEASIRLTLENRISLLEAGQKEEREQCQKELRDLRSELSHVNQMFVQFQLAVMKEMKHTPATKGILQAIDSLAHIKPEDPHAE